MFTVITPTGDRQRLFDLCQIWMSRQIVKPDRWIVVDDGKTPLKNTIGFTYIRRTRRPTDPRHTLKLNVLAALENVDQSDKVIIMEDDDWYSPNYLETINEGLNYYDLFGEDTTLYYHYPKKIYLRHPNTDRASLCQTGFTRNTIDLVRKICKERPNDPFLDLQLWHTNKVTKKVIHFEKPLVVSMKGLKNMGRIGASKFHRNPQGKKDEDLSYLTSIIGKDVELYDKI